MRADGLRGGSLRRSRAGFTLVEILAALAILAIALTAVFATFTSQQKSFTVQNRVAEMQQNLRQAVEHMTRDIRMAGYGLPDNVTIPTNVVAAGVTSLRSLYAKDNTTGPDQIYILYLFDMDANQPPTVNSVAMTGTGSVNVASTTGFLPAGGELVLITDNVTADLFMTSAAAGGVLTFGGGSSYNSGHAKLYGIGPPPATVAKARFVRYYIDSTTDAAHPTLMVDRMGGDTPQPVADDMEDLQLTYGLDTNADGMVDTWTPTPANLSQVRQVRLQILARTRVPETGWREIRPALGNRAAGATADGYRRRAIDVVIDVRNSGA